VLVDLDSSCTDTRRKGTDGLWVLHPVARSDKVEPASVAWQISAEQLIADVLKA